MKKLLIASLALGIFLLGSALAAAQEKKGQAGKPQVRGENGGWDQERPRGDGEPRKRFEDFAKKHPQAAERLKQRMKQRGADGGEPRKRLKKGADESPMKDKKGAKGLKKKKKGKKGEGCKKHKKKNDKGKRRPAKKSGKVDSSDRRAELDGLEKRIRLLRKRIAREEASAKRNR